MEIAPRHHPPRVADDPLGLALQPCFRFALAAQVGAGAEEPPGRAEHDATDRVILVGAVDLLGQLRPLRLGDRVAHLGSVERDAHDAVLDVEQDLIGVTHAARLRVPAIQRVA